GTLGLGPAIHGRRELFNPDQFMDHGGLLGETLYWTCSSLFSRAGAHLAFLFAFAAGLLLVTGTSAAGVVARARETASRGLHLLRGRLADERRQAQED